MTSILPRLTHNIRLAKEWKDAHPLPPEIPAIAQQLPTNIVSGTFQFGYNPSIVPFGDRVLMAYRWHEKPSWETTLAIAELDQIGKVVTNKKVELVGPANDDPRLFWHNGGLWVAYVHAIGIGKTTMRYGRLIDGKTWSVEGQTLIKYGHNDGMSMEKNWVPFSFDGNIHFIYSCDRGHVVIEVEGESLITEHLGVGAKWKWGECRGGTVPMPYLGKWLRFFHSRIGTRYYVGALLMEPKAPFNVVCVSKRPVLQGSMEDSLTPAVRSGVRHWKGNVVFPAGAIQTKDGWILSVGINDCQCGLVTVKESDLNL